MSKKERDEFQRGRESMHSMLEEARARATNAEALAREAGGLLVESRATHEMWKDVAPAYSLSKDIDKMLTKLRAAGLLKGGE